MTKQQLPKRRFTVDFEEPAQGDLHPETPGLLHLDMMKPPVLQPLPDPQHWTVPDDFEVPKLVPAGSYSAMKNPHAAALGRLGGLKGGRARAEALSPEQRREIARKAAAKRWNGKTR